MQPLTNKKFVVFDADDTLIQTIKIAFQVHKTVAKRYYDIDLTDELIKSLWGTPLKELMEQLYQHNEPFAEMEKKLFTVHDDIPMLAHNTVLDTLSKLKEIYLLGLVTASRGNIVSRVLGEGGIDTDIFSHFQASEDTNFHKPDGRVFEPMLTFAKSKGIQQNEILYVGDSIQDYLATKDTGIDFIAVNTGFTTKEDFITAGLDERLVMEEIGELMGILKTT